MFSCKFLKKMISFIKNNLFYRVFIKNVAQQLEQLETRGLFLCEDHGS